jgi:hypothetical protein
VTRIPKRPVRRTVFLDRGELLWMLSALREHIADTADRGALLPERQDNFQKAESRLLKLIRATESR